MKLFNNYMRRERENICQVATNGQDKGLNDQFREMCGIFACVLIFIVFLFDDYSRHGCRQLIYIVTV